MNLKYKVIACLTLCCTLFSCSDWLRVDPYDRVLEKNIFDNKKNIESSLNGIYLKMAAGNLYGSELSSRTIELLAQQYYIQPSFGSGENNVKIKYYLSTYNYAEAATKSIFSSIWSSGYNTILDINNFILKLENTPSHIITQGQRDLLLGEAYGLRAFMHLDMLRLFGPVYSEDSGGAAIPYRKNPNAEYKGRLIATEVMDSILVDIDQSILLLENDPVRTEGVMASPEEGLSPSQLDVDEFYRYRNRRLNYFAAQALKVRALMYKGDKGEAAILAKTLIDTQSLTEKFPWMATEDAFKVQREDRFFSSEVLFGIHSYNMYNYWDSYFNPSINDASLIYSSAKSYVEKIFDTQAGVVIPDMRSNNFKNWIGTSTNTDELMVSVRTQKSQIDTEAWNFQPLIRKSELYYAIAEAETDVAYLDSVRLNRGLRAIVDVNPSYDLKAEITKEFIREFKQEGQLFYYYKRIFAKSVQGATSASSTVSLSKNNYLAPIPEGELDW